MESKQPQESIIQELGHHNCIALSLFLVEGNVWRHACRCLLSSLIFETFEGFACIDSQGYILWVCDYSCLQCWVLFEGEISVSFVKCAFWGLFPLLLASIQAWLHLALFMVQVVKMLSVSVLRKVCYHLSFCMELVDWQLCQWPLLVEALCLNTCWDT